MYPYTITDESDKKSTISLSSKNGHNEYLHQSKVVPVAEWSGQVDEKVDPNTVAREAPEQGSTRRRRGAVDFDDEDDEQEDAAPSTSKATMPQSLPELISPPPQVPEPRLRKASTAASIVASDMLKSEVAETKPSMVPAAPTPPVAAAPSPEPEIVTSYRTRVVRADSDSETDSTHGQPTRVPEAVSSSIEPAPSASIQREPLCAESSNAPVSREDSQPVPDSEKPGTSPQSCVNPKQAFREAYGDPAPVAAHTAELDSSDMSRKKRQLLYTNSNTAVANPEAVQAESSQLATEGLVSGLAPVLEATKAFC